MIILIVVYAFIDSQNLNLGIQDQGWKLDFRRFRVYLKDKYKVDKALLFVGYIPENVKLYDYLQRSGYELVYKPTIETSKKTKGNVDTELVLWAAAREYGNYEKAVIVSGDGDFYCLIKYLEEKKKLLRVLIPNRKKFSSLLWNNFKNWLDYCNNLQEKLKYTPKTKNGGCRK